MQISVLNNHLKKVAFINNKIEKMLHYKNDQWHPYLSTGASTFDFTINKWSNGQIHEDAFLIDDTCFFGVRKHGRDLIYKITNYSEDDFEINVQCNSLDAELLRETVGAFTSTTAQPISWYLQQMGLMSFTFVKMGINELSNKKLTLIFDSQESKHDRLMSLVNKFDGEFELETVVKNDGSFDYYKLNLYFKNDETHQGVGKERTDVILYYGKDVQGVRIESNKDNLYNAFYASGQDENNKIIDIKDLEFSVKNEDGIEEFYTRKGSTLIYAPISAERFPNVTRLDKTDIWTRFDEPSTEYKDANSLLGYMKQWIREHAYPIYTYTVSMMSNLFKKDYGLDIGDTVTIHNNNFKDGLILKARVVELIESEDNPSINQVIFSNYRRIKNDFTSGVVSQIRNELNNQQPYAISVASSNGTFFKNQQGSTTATASLRKGTSVIQSTFSWLKGNTIVNDSDSLTVNGSDVLDTSVYTVIAYVDRQEVARTQAVFTNINDGISIVNTVRYYLLTNDGTNITTNTSGWTTSQQVLSGDFSYLWIYDKTTYSNGSVVNSAPIIIAQN